MRTDDISFYLEGCICRQCPSNVRGAEIGAFCHPSRSMKGIMVLDRGCLCSSCTVGITIGATEGYHCICTPTDSGSVLIF
ncbi:MAG TPA: DUF2769 domain-containing protein [Candidatus Methanomethylophilaceae archaeon]|nr:DUF2769 domain-containing protein [Candidatus Methanomethylophilaceae archaeon]